MTDRDASAQKTKRILIVAVIGVLLGMILLVGVSFWVIAHAHDVRLSVCKAQVADRLALRSVLIRAEEVALARATDMAQEEYIRLFYGDLLSTIPVLKCDDQGEPTPVR